MPGSEPVADIVYCHDAKCRPVRISGRATRAERPTGATRRRTGARVMSQKIRVEVVDDLDGSSPAAETIQFAYEGRRFEIDLSEANAARFRAMISEYADHARRAQLRPARRPRTGSDRRNAAEVRQWALAQGMSVSSAGRIPTRIRRTTSRTAALSPRRPRKTCRSPRQRPHAAAQRGARPRQVTTCRPSPSSRQSRRLLRRTVGSADHHGVSRQQMAESCSQPTWSWSLRDKLLAVTAREQEPADRSHHDERHRRRHGEAPVEVGLALVCESRPCVESRGCRCAD